VNLKSIFLFGLLCLLASPSWAQYHLVVSVVDLATGEHLEAAGVRCDFMKKAALTNKQGFAAFDMPAGTYYFSVLYVGYTPQKVEVKFPGTGTVLVKLVSALTEVEAVVISSTRNNSRLENSAVKVEVLGHEELDEENGIKPGNVSSLLGDISSIQLQQTSATSGNTVVRIQGLDGRYTQILRDGLPQFDGLSGNFGILQVAPLDLKQIEIIKGSASVLYGGDAIAGVINFISKSPSRKPVRSITINQSTLGESNLNAFVSARNKKYGYTCFAGITNQMARDVNHDGFSDVTKMKSVNVHPRFFYYPNPKASLVFGYTLSAENREGGDMQVLKGNTDTLHQYYEQNNTLKQSVDIIYNQKWRNQYQVCVKASTGVNQFAQSHADYQFRATQFTSYAEVSCLRTYKKASALLGLSSKSNQLITPYANADNQLSQASNTLGGFAQYNWEPSNTLHIVGGLRVDRHARYGWFVLPDVAMIWKLHKCWYLRSGMGSGYKTPTLLQGSYSPIDINRIQNKAKAEYAKGAHLEINYQKSINKDLSVLVNESFFSTHITHPVLDSFDGVQKVIYNERRGIQTSGFDTYIRIAGYDAELYLGYTYTYAQRLYDAASPAMRLTPKHRLAATAMYEFDEHWRIGIESSFMGQQYLPDGRKSKAYWFYAMMLERKWKQIRVVLNAENLGNIKQSNYEQTVLPPVSHPVFRPIWAPLEGRVINLSLVWNL